MLERSIASELVLLGTCMCRFLLLKEQARVEFIESERTRPTMHVEAGRGGGSKDVEG